LQHNHFLNREVLGLTDSLLQQRDLLLATALKIAHQNAKPVLLFFTRPTPVFLHHNLSSYHRYRKCPSFQIPHHNSANVNGLAQFTGSSCLKVLPVLNFSIRKAAAIAKYRVSVESYSHHYAGEHMHPIRSHGYIHEYDHNCYNFNTGAIKLLCRNCCKSNDSPTI